MYSDNLFKKADAAVPWLLIVAMYFASDILQ